MILARNIDYKITKQKILKKFGLIASRYEPSKIEIKEQLLVRLTSQTSLFMFLQSAFHNIT